MGKIQLVIEIDKEHYERIMRFEEGVTVYSTTLALYEAVKNGKPLPKNHGRLIDEDCIKCDDYENLLIRRETITRTPTIIERYRGGGEDEN